MYYLLLCLKIAGCVANSLDPDKTPHSKGSYLGLHCLLRLVCPNTFKEYMVEYFLLFFNLITKTCLYNSDPLEPHFYIVKLGFTGLYIILLISS